MKRKISNAARQGFASRGASLGGSGRASDPGQRPGAVGTGLSGRRISLPDGTEGEIIREVRSPGGRLLELAYRRLPDGEEQRLYVEQGGPAGECRGAAGRNE